MSEKPQNQCDGCAIGLPVDANGNHTFPPPGDPFELLVGCTARNYDPAVVEVVRLREALADRDRRLDAYRARDAALETDGAQPPVTTAEAVARYDAAQARLWALGETPALRQARKP